MQQQLKKKIVMEAQLLASWKLHESIAFGFRVAYSCTNNEQYEIKLHNAFCQRNFSLKVRDQIKLCDTKPSERGQLSDFPLNIALVEMHLGFVFSIS